MFTTLIVQPIFNLLVFIYALLPGHDFGVAIVIFTLVIRLLLWPLVKKQLHQTKKMRALQPELKRIKKETKGDRQKESMLMMELYKERQINPFATLGLTLAQLPILLGLYYALSRLIQHPGDLSTFTYPFIRELGWVKELTSDMSKFQPSFFGLVDLKRAAYTKGAWYIPGLILVAASAVIQYLTSKQLMPTADAKKGIRQILQDASKGKQADQSEMQAATGRFTTLLIPIMIFFITLGIASALSLYWFVGGLIAYFQNARVLKQDEEEMEELADAPIKPAKVRESANTSTTALEGEVIPAPPKPKSSKKSKSAHKKRRKR